MQCPHSNEPMAVMHPVEIDPRNAVRFRCGCVHFLGELHRSLNCMALVEGREIRSGKSSPPYKYNRKRAIK